MEQILTLKLVCDVYSMLIFVAVDSHILKLSEGLRLPQFIFLNPTVSPEQHWASLKALRDANCFTRTDHVHEIMGFLYYMICSARWKQSQDLVVEIGDLDIFGKEHIKVLWELEEIENKIKDKDQFRPRTKLIPHPFSSNSRSKN